MNLKKKEYATTKPLELVHTYLCGSTRNKGLNGELYFFLFIDDFTQMTWAFLIKKLETFEYFKIFNEVVENEIDLKIKFLILYNGG